MIRAQQYLTPTASVGGLPFLNSLFTNTSGLFAELGEKPSYLGFVKFIKRCPQLIAFTDIIVSDIISDELKFIPPDHRSSGRNNILRAKQFWRSNDGNTLLKETIRDYLLFGIGYNYVAALDKNFQKEVRNKIKVFESKELGFKADQIYEDIAPEFVKKLRHVAASTMNISHSETEITGYIQRVGINTKYYSPDEIITMKFMPFNGEVYPYCPLECLLAEIYLLWLISQNYVSFFENGGHPDKVFILPKEQFNSPNYKQLVDTLQKYKKIQNKHGNLVFTGDITIEDMMKVEKDMAHQDLALYVTGVLALFYKVPAGRIPFLIGKASSMGDAGGLADAGYWRQISVMQSDIENAYNVALFEPYFNVCLTFGRGYKQDEVRETATEMQRVQIAEQMMNLGLWSSEYAAFKLDVPDDVLEEAKVQKEERDAAQAQLDSGMLNQNLTNKKDSMPNPDKQKKNAKKGNTQNRNMQNNPSNYSGKEYTNHSGGLWLGDHN